MACKKTILYGNAVCLLDTAVWVTGKVNGLQKNYTIAPKDSRDPDKLCYKKGCLKQTGTWELAELP